MPQFGEHRLRVAPRGDRPLAAGAAVLWLTSGVAVGVLSAVIAILVTETFGLRSVLFHALAGGLIGLFCGYTLGFIGPLPRIDFDMPLGTNFELLAAAAR